MVLARYLTPANLRKEQVRRGLAKRARLVAQKRGRYRLPDLFLLKLILQTAPLLGPINLLNRVLSLQSSHLGCADPTADSDCLTQGCFIRRRLLIQAKLLC
jgi:hypothetical protein